MPLNSIQQRVEERVAANHVLIVEAVFQHKIKKHNHITGCACNYCILLKDYVNTKRKLQKLKQNMDNDEWWKDQRYELLRVQDPWARLEFYKTVIKNMKEYKDSLKILR